MSPVLEQIPVGLIANRVAIAAGMETGIPGLKNDVTLGEMAEHVKNLRMAAGMVASHIKKVKDEEAKGVANLQSSQRRSPQSSMGYSGGSRGGSTSRKSSSPSKSSSPNSPSSQDEDDSDDYSPLADPNFKSDALEEQKEENARAQGLRESKRSISNDSGTYDDQSSPADVSAVAQDQNIMSRQRDLYLSKLKKMRMQKAIDARKAQKVAADKVAKFLVQKVGMRFATAAFMASFVGFLIGYLLVLFRCVAADIFMVESQKFDDISEQLTYWTIVILGLVVLMLPVVLVVIMIGEEFKWLIKLIGWLQGVFKK